MGLKVYLEILGYHHNLFGDDFMDWLDAVERIFDYQEVPDEKKVKLVAMKLKGGASAWWEQTKVTRERCRKPKVRTWEKMNLMKAAFLLVDYVQTLFRSFKGYN